MVPPDATGEAAGKRVDLQQRHDFTSRNFDEIRARSVMHAGSVDLDAALGAWRGRYRRPPSSDKSASTRSHGPETGSASSVGNDAASQASMRHDTSRAACIPARRRLVAFQLIPAIGEAIEHDRAGSRTL